MRVTNARGLTLKHHTGRPRGSIAARGKGKWLVRVSGPSYGSASRARVNKLVHGTKADAQRALTELLRGLDQGTLTGQTRETLGDWISEWQSAWCRDISQRTRRDYANNIRRYVPSALLAKRLSALAASDVQRLLNDLSDRGLAPRTVRYLHATLRRALNVAVRVGRIPRNVATLADPPRLNRREMRALDADAARAFVAAAEGTRYEALWLTLLTTGLRPSEAYALRWSDLRGSQLSVQRALVRAPGGQWALEEPKTARSRRIIALAPMTIRALEGHRARQKAERALIGSEYTDHGLIFATETGSPLDHSNLSMRHFKPLVREVGLPALRLYDLRHSAATLLLLEGINPKVVSEMLGHATIVLTLDTYSHVLPEMQKSAVAKLELLLNQRRPADTSFGVKP